MEAVKKDRVRLIAAAMGNIPFDLSIENIRLVNVITGEIYPACVDILDGIIVNVRETSEQCVSKKRIDGKANYLLPGFIDTHVHVESTMMTPDHFAKAVMPWGTTTVISDPHEIVNVMGVDGMLFMLERARKESLRHYMLAPPCVPSVPGLENSGSTFTEKEVGFLLDQPNVIGIAELMNYIDICNNDKRMHQIIEEGVRRDAFLQGHGPRLTGNMLTAYRLAGIRSDHECRGTQEVIDKSRMGMNLNFKISSLSNHLSASLQGIKEHRWKDNISLCTDDVHTRVILEEGHLNRVVRKAIEYGADPLDAIRFATYNAAREYGFHDLGAIAPGYAADMQLVSALDGSRPDRVWIGGEEVGSRKDEESTIHLTSGSTLSKASSTVHLEYLNTESDFVLYAPDDTSETLVIYSRYDEPFHSSFYEELPIQDGKVDITHDKDLAYIGVFNRHGLESKTISVIRNFGVTSGAFATTVAHDCHNLIMVYRDPKDALATANKVKEMGGGFVYAEEGRVLGYLQLPIGGLMSELPCSSLGIQVKEMEELIEKRCSGNWLLKLSTTALPALPGTIITDVGVLDGTSRKFIPQFRSRQRSEKKCAS